MHLFLAILLVVSDACGWVLWQNMISKKTGDGLWAPLKGYATVALCEDAAKLSNTGANRMPNAYLDKYSVYYTCFPNDFDPREKRKK